MQPNGFYVCQNCDQYVTPPPVKCPADFKMLGDRVFILSMAVYALIDQIDGIEAGFDLTGLGQPHSAHVTVDGHRYRLTIDDRLTSPDLA